MPDASEFWHAMTLTTRDRPHPVREGLRIVEVDKDPGMLTYRYLIQPPPPDDEDGRDRKRRPRPRR